MVVFGVEMTLVDGGMIMKIRLLIATGDKSYAEQLSKILAEKYAETFDISVCSSLQRLPALLSDNNYDVALLESGFENAADLSSISLPLMLMEETGVAGESGLKYVRKYQRISSIAGNVMEYYAETGKSTSLPGAERAHITAVWSPAGGVGKTVTALALAANRAQRGKQATYLNMESFSSTSVYFAENGRSISKVFEKLDTNLDMLLTGIRQQDAVSGVSYFCSPENYDDMNILEADDIETLVNACASVTDELVADLPSQCDGRVQRVLDIADTVLLVCDASSTSQVKLKQFVNQHNVFERIKNKTVLVNNKSAANESDSFAKSIRLPSVQTADAAAVFKALSGADFVW